MKRYFALFLVGLFLITGCTNQTKSEDKLRQEAGAYEIIQTSNQAQQTIANEAKKKLNEQIDFNALYAVNTDSKLLIGIEPRQRDRFQLKFLQNNVEEEMKKLSPSLDVEISTDKKIILELQKLEENLTSERIGAKALEKELDRIIKLSKEET